LTEFAMGSPAWLVPEWPAPPRVRALTTTRALPGNSRPPFDAFNLGMRSGEDAAIVSANRGLLQRGCQLPAAPRWLQQVHGSYAIEFTAAGEDQLDEPQADAAFTGDPGVVLAVLTADCLPILICADDGAEIAAIHAGWRGLAAGVVESCIEQLRTQRETLMAWLGPAIGAASYEVGDEVRDAFFAHSDEATMAFAPSRSGHWRCDLYTLATQRLNALGIARVYGGGLDTYSDARFYSYRREPTTGRFASVIWIQP
jgi:polyphenol oxidase